MATVVSEKEVHEEKVEVKTKPFNFLMFLQEVRSEFFKISWPSRDQVTKEFFSVILLVSILTGIIFAIDRALTFVIDLFSGKI